MIDIKHVVVLMLENRSFDCMLGRLYPGDPDFDGLTLNESNVCKMTYGVWTDPHMTPAIASIPDPDPGESFTDMNTQLFGTPERPGEGTKPTMCGFAQNYSMMPPKEGWRDPGAVMHYFTPDQVPVISSLAKAFGVCDEWFASAPCQTWPNRFFTHAATALGYIDNSAFRIPFEAPSLFRRLEDLSKTWRVYFHDMPQSLLLRDVWPYALTRYRLFKQFLADAHVGALPNYSFIEPRYFTDLFSNFIPNDEHPPHNVLYGEQLIAQVYNAVRSSPCWKRTLLIITYDEHGGCYDHVAPPPSIQPDAAMANEHKFLFDSYGVRVPAVIVSPYIPPGSKIHAPRNDKGPVIPFDHTSIIKTVREIFSLGERFTARDEAAPSIVPALSLLAPNNDGPPSITAVLVPAPVAQLTTRASAAPNGMQAALSAAATMLPQAPPALTNVVPEPGAMPKNPLGTVATAQANVTVRTSLFLGVQPPAANG
jgi:phospholipase C